MNKPSIAIALSILGLTGVGCSPTPTSANAAPGPQSIRFRVNSADLEHMVEAEEWIRTRGDSLRAIKLDLLNLQLPGPAVLPHCGERLHVTPLGRPRVIGQAIGGAVELYKLVLPLQQGAGKALQPSVDQPWWPMLREWNRIDSVQIGVLGARYVAGPKPCWSAMLKVSLAGVAEDGSHLGVLAKVETEWELPVGEDGHRSASPGGADLPSSGPEAQGDWRLSRFATKSLKLKRAPELLFDGSTDNSIEDPALAADLAQSGQDEALLARRFHGQALPDEFLMNATTALAVVDINGDGFDDIYLMPRHRPNRLLVNTGRGTFEEDAHSYGLDLPGGCSSAAFADLDNDGDLDLVLGRIMNPTQAFLRTGDRFVERQDLFLPALPASASAVALADFNLDGVLDVYVATYAAGPLQEQRNASETFANQDLKIRSEAKKRKADEFFQLRGPANALYLSQPDTGWLLATGPGSGALESHSFGASCSDYDQDGDQDLYCSNDFGPDVLLCNDGSGRFVDVTNTVELIAGFGMGASWGDYDGDGDFDIYVSNMYSKAGTRIANLLPGLPSRIAEAATGNFLLRNTGSGFELASDNMRAGQEVSKAGWSYSSQFIDVDNDARLDIFCPNGYFTAPAALAKDEDL